MRKIRKGDEVVAIAGKDKGRQGTVLKVEASGRVLVEGLNKVKKHQRPNPMKGQPGGIVEKEMSIHASNLAIYNAGMKKADRVGIKTLQDGRKVRVYKSNSEQIDA